MNSSRHEGRRRHERSNSDGRGDTRQSSGRRDDDHYEHRDDRNRQYRREGYRQRERDSRRYEEGAANGAEIQGMGIDHTRRADAMAVGLGNN